MKKYIVLCAGFCFAVAMTSCKSSESAYKKAYEKAKQYDTQATQQTAPAYEEPAIVAPVQTQVANETSKVDNYDNVANYRIDRIMDIRPLSTPSKPRNRVAGLEDGLKLEKYLYQHVNMFSGDPERVEFIIPESFVSVVIDFFGSHVSFFDMGDGFISCSLEVSLEAMRHWAGQFADVVRVVSPECLVEQIREHLRKANANYGM